MVKHFYLTIQWSLLNWVQTWDEWNDDSDPFALTVLLSNHFKLKMQKLKRNENVMHHLNSLKFGDLSTENIFLNGFKLFHTRISREKVQK